MNPTAPQSGAAAVEFWSTTLGRVTAPTPLVLARTAHRGAGRQPAGLKILEHPSVAAVPAVHSSQNVPGNELWVAAWALLLARHAGDDSVLFGRTHPRAPDSALPIAVTIESNEDSTSFLARVAMELAAAESHATASLSEIRASCGIPDDAPLFESLLVTTAVNAQAVCHAAEQLGVALAVGVLEGSGRLVAAYDPERLTVPAVDRMLAQFAQLARGLAAENPTPVSRLPLLPDDEYRRVVHDWNATDVDFPRDVCLHELFERQVAERPGAVAVIAPDATLTYAQLDARANQLAHRLHALGVVPDTPVGVALDRTAEMVVALVAIAKAGGAYLPLDPAYPAERLRVLAEEADPSVLVTREALLERFPPIRARAVCVDRDRDALAALPTSPVPSGVRPEHLAYVIFTSGSTGTPKGVMVDHRGRVNNFLDFNVRYSVGPGDRLLALSSISFDMCAYDVFGTLAAGAAIVVGDAGERLEPAAWAALMREHGVTVWHSVPALLEMLVAHVEHRPSEHPAQLRLVLLGGDWIPVSLPDRVRAVAHPGVRVIAMGGATECSMDSTIFEIGATDPLWRSIPYGAPMWNQRAYVLDQYLQPVPIGVPGELFLGGVGVGRGYYRRPDLTAERFIDNPFVAGERMYRTGDLCRWREDGNLELLGRTDFQVKVRGFRVELGEIEAVLRQHAAVHEVVVVARDAPGGARDKKLVAYCTTADGAGSTGTAASLARQLREHVAARLPAHMVPAAVVVLREFPLTPNGKVNRRLLPEPSTSRDDLDLPFDAPRSAVERVLCALWADATRLDKAGVRDSLLALGGSSLLATQVAARVDDVLGVRVNGQRCLTLEIGELAAALEADAGAGVRARAELYLHVVSLSDDEVRAQLQEGRP